MLEALNGGVDPLAGRIRDPVKNVIEDAFGVVPGHVRDFFQRLQPASKDRLHPLAGEPARPAPLPATPEVIEVFLQRPRGAGLQILHQQRPEFL